MEAQGRLSNLREKRRSRTASPQGELFQQAFLNYPFAFLLCKILVFLESRHEQEPHQGALFIGGS